MKLGGVKNLQPEDWLMVIATVRTTQTPLQYLSGSSLSTRSQTTVKAFADGSR
jgi:hypothetical protein